MNAMEVRERGGGPREDCILECQQDWYATSFKKYWINIIGIGMIRLGQRAVKMDWICSCFTIHVEWFLQNIFFKKKYDRSVQKFIKW